MSLERLITLAPKSAYADCRSNDNGQDPARKSSWQSGRNSRARASRTPRPSAVETTVFYQCVDRQFYQFPQNLRELDFGRIEEI